MVPAGVGPPRAGPLGHTRDNVAVNPGETERHQRSNAFLRWSLMASSALLALASVALIAVRWPEQRDNVPPGAIGGAIGAGIAFRCADPSNCWTVSIVPQLESIGVFRTQGGTLHLVRNLGALGDTDSVKLSVSQSGRQLTFLVNDERRAVLVDGHLAGQRGIGLTALRLTSVGRTSWTDFSVALPDGSTRVDPLRDNEARPLESVPSTFSWRKVSGRWTVGPDGARFSRHGGAPIELALADESPADSTIGVTLNGIR